METIMNLLTEWVGEEAFFNIIAAVVGTVWVWFQRKMRLDQVTDQRFVKAMQFLEAGVSTTYQKFVKERKIAAVDGKLTEDEKRQARELAYSHARDYAYRGGLDLVKELGADLIPGLLEMSVGKLKTECSGPVATKAVVVENNKPQE